MVKIAFLAALLAASAQAGDCNARAVSPSVTIPLPAPPFGIVPTQDGCWLFVSMVGGPVSHAGIAGLRRMDGRVELQRWVPVNSLAALGMTLTHDGKLLVVAAGDDVWFLDVARLIAGTGDSALGQLSDGDGAGSVYANITADDKLLFVSDEDKRSITVIDLEKARGNGYKAEAIIGKIPVGELSIALMSSPDGKTLYTTSEAALPEWKWPKACTPEGSKSAEAKKSVPEGAVIVVDVARAKINPAEAVVARVPAGCSPVRMALSPVGDRIYVTARNSNAVLVFDTGKLVSDGAHARIGTMAVGSAPVPVAVIDQGRKLIAGNSNRFAAGNQPQTLTVLDAVEMKTLGQIAAGAFPREMSLSADGHTLFLTNFGSKSLQVLDVDRLPIQ
jgi:DNA-binding beta-propeller fold protein YncE